MDRLSDLAAVGETRTASCPEHGDFESRRVVRSIWTKCPACEAARARADQEEAARVLKADAERRHRDRLTFSRVPNRFVGRTFDSFVATTDAHRHALTVVRSFAEDFKENYRRGLGLILSGLPGTGKSHLAAAVLQTMLERDVCYVTCLDMVREVRATWRRDSPRSELDVLETFGSMDLLVIDEVGVQYGTEGEQTIIFDVLDRRYREVLPTILLTNQDKVGFKEFVGERTFDRLTETCRWVPFDWPSYRPQARRDGAAKETAA